MNAKKSTRIYYWLWSFAVVLLPFPGMAEDKPPASSARSQPPTTLPDGVRDFDFEIGTWKTSVSRLQRPLTGSTTWIEYQGTTVVRGLLGGLANLAELDIAGTAGRIQGVSLRLYNPETRQWSLNFSNLRTGTLSPPTIGGFANGRGEFLGHETLEGRPILVRFVVACSTSDTCRFEQAFSADDGKTWEVNWIATDTRVVDSAGPGP